MSATVINYLYEDLPEGHTVLASEWNTAMRQIKETINLHAVIIDQKIRAPFIITIDGTENSWINTAGYSYYRIPESLHNKGTQPQIALYTLSNDGEYTNLHPVTTEFVITSEGDVAIFSNSSIPLCVVIR